MNCLVSTFLRVHLLFSFQRPSVPLQRPFRGFLHRGSAFYANLGARVKRPSLDFFWAAVRQPRSGTENRPSMLACREPFGPSQLDSYIRFGIEPRDTCGSNPADAPLFTQPFRSTQGLCFRPRSSLDHNPACCFAICSVRSAQLNFWSSSSSRLREAPRLTPTSAAQPVPLEPPTEGQK